MFTLADTNLKLKHLIIRQVNQDSNQRVGFVATTIQKQIN